MCFFLSFAPATFWAVIGYFVFFSSTKAEGALKTFGQALAIWVFVLVGFILIGGAYITVADMCPIPELLKCTG